MRGIRLIGLCLVVAFAFSALSVASAPAAELGQCRALNSDTTPKSAAGVYSDANCQIPYEIKGKQESKGNYDGTRDPRPIALL